MEENKHLLDAFFALLRAGLWGTTPDPAFFVSFTETQWQALLALAQKQAVLGLIYAGVSRLPKELMPNQQLLLRLYGFSEQIASPVSLSKYFPSFSSTRSVGTRLLLGLWYAKEVIIP